MKYELTEKPATTASECLVIGTFGEIKEVNLFLNETQKTAIAPLFKHLNPARNRIWQTVFDQHSLLLVHCGERTKYNLESFFKILEDVAQQLIQQKISSVTLCLPSLDMAADEQLEQTVLKLNHIFYQLLDFKQDKNKAHPLNTISIYLPGATTKALTDALTIAEAISHTRTLANLPANVCTPSFLAEKAIKLAQKYPKLEATILNEDDLKTLGMGAFLAVAQGSHEQPKLIELHYHGAAKTPPIILVGKGITFDSGGISLKPSNGMEEMKYDMAGAATVLGVLQACAALKLPLHVIGLMACAENMPGGGAVKPGDIVTTLSGQTVEIVNTDAEGRLVLSDTLTYAERFNPRFVIDVATLTGAVIIALGHENSGLMTEDDSLAALIQECAQKSHDPIWRLPLQSCYQEALDSPLADMVNATFDKSAGSIIGACFLSRFTKKYSWAHLDIAGTAWISGRKNQATGRPVPLLVEILRHAARES